MTPRRLAPDEFRRLPRYGLGLTDVCKTDFGADSELEPSADDPDAVIEKIRRCQPRFLAFVGKRPAVAVLGRRRLSYALQPEPIGRTRLFVLPSPSGRARAFWDEAPWRTLARLASLEPEGSA